MNIKLGFLILSSVFITTTYSTISYAVEAEGTNAPTSVAPTGQQCDADAFYDSLGQSESGGCGGGNQYNCVGPVINNGGIHQGDTPLGKYQFMPNTLEGLGIPVEGFVGNAAAQEEAIRRFNERNNSCIDQPYTSNGVSYPAASDAIGTTVNGVLITRSGLLGASHLAGCGGARTMIRTQGAGASDQLGTSALGYADKFGGYGIFGDVAGGTCGGGVANAADLFSQAQAQGLHNMIGCDPSVFQAATDRANALVEQENEIVKATITQPIPVEQANCVDQHTELIKAAMTHSNPDGDNTSIATLIQKPLMQAMEEFMEGNIAGSISSMVNNSFNTITSSFLGGLGGGGAPETNCPMNDAIWDIAQCIEMPEISSLSNILGGRLDALIGDIESAPERISDQVCRDIGNKLGGFLNNANDVFDNAAQSATQPLSDAASAIAY